MDTSALDPIRLAHDCADAAAFERAVLGDLQRAVGFDTAFFVAIGETPTTVQVDRAALERAFGAHAYDREMMPLKRTATARRGVVVDTQLLGERAVRRQGYHRHFAAPVGGRHTLMAYLGLRGRPLGAVMLGRCGSDFAARELGAIEALLPSLAVARASFREPWRGGPLPRAGSTTLASWARGETLVASVGEGDDRVVVRDRAGHREMVARRGEMELVWSRARLDDPRRSGWFYVDLFHLAAARARSRQRVLFIGAGGAVAVRQFAEVYPGVAIDLVDLDPRVITLAHDWYGLGSIPGLAVHVAEGAGFVARAPSDRWDVVVVDAYDGADVPAALVSRGFFRGVRRVLRAGGCMAFNVIGALAGDGPLRTVERAAARELDDVRLVPVLDPGEAYDPAAVRNVVVLGGRA